MSKPTPVDFGQLDHFAGFDWGHDKHAVVIVDRQGTIVRQGLVEQTAEGWAMLRQQLAPLGPVGAAIETNCGPAVERLLEMGLSVYPMNPKAAERFRDRKAPSGVKDDLLDAWSFADALRSDGHGWRVLQVDDEPTRLLRMLCRDEIGLIEQRTALVNQLRAALYEYYPAALEAFDDWTAPSPWDFVIQFPTPAKLVAAGKRQWQKFMHTHRLYQPQMAQKRLVIFARANQFASSSTAVTAAKSLLALTWPNNCARSKRRSRSTASRSNNSLPITPITTSSTRCRAPATSWPRGCWARSARSVRSSTRTRRCSATPAPPRSPGNRASDASRPSAGCATARCAPRCICGPT